MSGKIKLDEYTVFDIAHFKEKGKYPEGFPEIRDQAVKYLTSLETYCEEDLTRCEKLLFTGQAGVFVAICMFPKIIAQLADDPNADIYGKWGRKYDSGYSGTWPVISLFLNQLVDATAAIAKEADHFAGRMGLAEDDKAYYTRSAQSIAEYYKPIAGAYNVAVAMHSSFNELSLPVFLDHIRVLDEDMKRDYLRNAPDIPELKDEDVGTESTISLLEKRILLGDYSAAYKLSEHFYSTETLMNQSAFGRFHPYHASYINRLKNPASGTLEERLSQIENWANAANHIARKLKRFNRQFIYLKDFVSLENNPHTYGGMYENEDETNLIRTIYYYTDLYNHFLRLYYSIARKDTIKKQSPANAPVSELQPLAEMIFQALQEEHDQAMASQAAPASQPAKKQPQKSTPCYTDVEPEESQMLKNLSLKEAISVSEGKTYTVNIKEAFSEELYNLACRSQDPAQAVELYEKAILFDVKNEKAYRNLSGLVNALKKSGAIGNNNSLTGNYVGTAGKALAKQQQNLKQKFKIPRFKRFSAFLGLLMCLALIGYIWIADPETIGWIGNSNPTKAIIMTAVAAISGLLSKGILLMLLHVAMSWGVLYGLSLVAEFYPAFMDYPMLIIDRGFLTASMLLCSISCFLFFKFFIPVSLNKKRGKKFQHFLNLAMEANRWDTHIKALLEKIETANNSFSASDSKIDAALSYYKSLEQAFSYIHRKADEMS